ncbi:hypothetical protein [Sphingomonas sp. Leaf343]|uniref:hypothetical protein n=1 Tax=Sphingomonas sp. Leaf343 TaxID=1736345 RepID=UPI0012E1298C|nr:hypothetical protein [Sphingomonas sp. Leaf343]
MSDHVKPGTLIQRDPDADPYLVQSVAARGHAWNLTGWDAPDGQADRNEARRWWLNGWVAQRYAAAPLGFILRPIEIFDYDCPGRDCLFVVLPGQAFVARRSGQIEMFA